MPYRWKGKQRADPESVRRWYPRDDEGDLGSGGGDGILLPLLYIGLEGTDASYSVPIQIGSSGQSISLQIDTGSSDMWVASSSCSSGPCGSVPSNKRFDPSSSSDNVNIGQPFRIDYLRGGVNGTVMFDTVSVGGYSIGGQAFAAADSVESESLSGDFSGIFGLALPANSIISNIVPPTTNSFDGATVGSNIFSLTPISLAPAARFLSLTLSRPGSDAVPALLGIGKHPTQQVPQIDQSKIVYSTPLPTMSSAGTSASPLFWKSSINDITVWVNGEPKSVSLTTTNAFTPGSSGPTAVLDSGIPVILATKALADGIYGALGIGPASDGNYYVDCSTPLNLTITLDGRAPIPVHPLDLTLVPPNDVSSKSCIGMIQAASTPISDMILGVPFLRSVYMVMAYQVPERDGSFTDLRPTEESDSEAGAAVANEIRPRLGLQSLVDASTALDEFHQVRVLGQPLSHSPSNSGSGSGKSGHLSVGVEVLLGLLGFFALCVGLFALRFFLMRRKYSRGDIGNGPSTAAQNIPGGAQSGGLFGFFRRNKQSGYANEKSRGEYELADTGKEGPPPSEDELRQIRYHAYLNKERYPSSYSTSTARTRVDEEQGHADEFGGKKKRSPSAGSDARSQSDDHGHDATRNVYGDPWDPTTAHDWDNTNPTLVGKGPRTHRKNATELSDPQPPSPTAAERVPMLSADRLSPTAPSFAHVRERSVDLPPLPHDSPIEETPMVASANANSNDLEEFGVTSMAGIGTAARGSFIDTDIQFSHKHSGSMSSTASTLYNGRPRPGRSPSGPRGSSHSTGSRSNNYTPSGSGNRPGSSGLGS